MTKKSMSHKDMIDSVLDLAKPWADKQERALLLWAADLHLSEFDPTPDDLLVGITDGPDDLGIDLIFDPEDDGDTIYLFQSKLAEQPRRLRLDEVAGFLGAPGRLVDPSVLAANKNTKILQHAPLFAKRMADNFQLEMVFVTTAKKTASAQNEVERWNREPLLLTLPQGVVEVRHSAIVSDVEELHTRQESASSDKPADLTLTLPRKSFHVIESGGFRCMQATLQAVELVRVFDDIRYALFRFNPRGPLGNVRVNSEMRATLADPEMRKHFHLLNNGLSAVCESFTPRDKGDNVELELRDFQIVNGCQTTYTLWDHWRRQGSLSGVWISLKVVEAPTLRDHISKASNRQSQMKDWDFLFDDPEQRRLQREFAKLRPPYFYELRRGEYKFMAGAPSAQRVTAKGIAQATWAFLGNPGEAKDKLREIPQTRGKKTGPYAEVFFPGVSPEFLRLAWEVFQRVKVEHERFVEQTGIEGDYREYGRLHMVWLIARGLTRWANVRDWKDVSPARAAELCQKINEWFGPLQDWADKALQWATEIEQGIAEELDRPFSLRQVFRSREFYPRFEKGHDNYPIAPLKL